MGSNSMKQTEYSKIKYYYKVSQCPCIRLILIKGFILVFFINQLSVNELTRLFFLYFKDFYIKKLVFQIFLRVNLDCHKLGLLEVYLHSLIQQ